MIISVISVFYRKNRGKPGANKRPLSAVCKIRVIYKKGRSTAWNDSTKKAAKDGLCPRLFFPVRNMGADLNNHKNHETQNRENADYIGNTPFAEPAKKTHIEKDGAEETAYHGEKTAQKTFRDFKPLFYLIIACLVIITVIWYYRDIVNVINYYLGRLSAVIYGLFIAYLLNPIMRYCEPVLEKRFLASRKEKVRKKAKVMARRRSIAIALGIGVLIIAILIMMIIPQVLNSVVALGEEVPSLITKITTKLDKWNTDRSWAGNFQKYIDTALDSIETWITETLVPQATHAVISLTSAAWSVLMFVINFLIGMIISVYVLKEKKHFVSWGKKLSYAFLKPETANLIIDTARHGNKVFGEYLIGSLIDSALVGVICFIFNAIAGIPYPLLLATIIGITNIIPFFGPFLGAIPSGFIILLIDPFKALIFLIFIFVLNQIEGNIIAPKILGNVTGISEFWVTFALLFFGAMFGVFGMIIGVPFLAVLSYIFTKLVDKHMEKKKLVSDADYYFDVYKYDVAEDSFEMIDYKQLEIARKNKVKPRNERFAAAWNSFIHFFRRKKR